MNNLYARAVGELRQTLEEMLHASPEGPGSSISAYHIQRPSPHVSVTLDLADEEDELRREEIDYLERRFDLELVEAKHCRLVLRTKMHDKLATRVVDDGE